MRRSWTWGCGVLALLVCGAFAGCGDDEEASPSGGAGGSAGSAGAAGGDSGTDATDAPADAAAEPDVAIDAPDEAADAPAETSADAADDTAEAGDAADESDAATDATDATDAADAADAPAEATDASDAAAVPACGSSPYQRFDPITAQVIALTPQTDVTVTTSICGGTSVAVPYQGSAKLDVQIGVPFWFMGTQSGSLTALGIEQNIQMSLLAQMPMSLVMLAPTYPAVVFPSFDSTKHALLRAEISSTASGATSPCDDKAGVTFAVPGHAEAVVVYPNSGTSTGSGGDANAWIVLQTTGTDAAPEMVTVTATKSGCTVGLDAVSSFFLTGRAPVAVNAVTWAVGYEIKN